MLEGLGSRMEKDVLLDKYRKPKLNALYVEDWSSLTKKFLKAFPYSLTSSQLTAVSEIIWDLKRPVPMNRLLQVWIVQLCSDFSINSSSVCNSLRVHALLLTLHFLN